MYSSKNYNASNNYTRTNIQNSMNGTGGSNSGMYGRQDSYGLKHRSSQNGSVGKRDSGSMKTFSTAAR